MDYKSVNQTAWNTLTNDHLQSDFYDVEGFIAGDRDPNPIDLEALPDVNGKSLLHLQCHFGMDTLAWAARGATVTGVDLSPNAIAAAKELALKCELDGEFICSDLYGFGETNERQFDIVYTSYGVLAWLPDMTRWAEVVAAALKPGGTFYIGEFHPSVWLLDGASYFPQKEAYVETWEGYTEIKSEITTHEWPHSLSEVFTALLDAGLRITSFAEYPYTFSGCIEGSVEREPGKWYRTHKDADQPLIFTLTATK